MALDRAYRIRCDRCWSATGYADTSALARAAARRAHWKRTPKKDGDPGGDVCQRCVAAESTKEGETP